MLPKTWQGVRVAMCAHRTCELSPFPLEILIFAALEQEPPVPAVVQGTASARAPEPGKVVLSLQRIASKLSLFASSGASCFLNK